MALHNGLLRSIIRPWLPTATLSLGVATLIAGGAVVGFRTFTPHSYALQLSVERRPDAIYFTAFDGDDVAITDHNDQKPIVFRRNFSWMDGCTWQAVEELTPAGGGYLYHYAEHPESCPNGERPDGSPSVLTGTVTVTQLPATQPVTSLDADTAPQIVMTASQDDDQGALVDETDENIDDHGEQSAD